MRTIITLLFVLVASAVIATPPSKSYKCKHVGIQKVRPYKIRKIKHFGLVTVNVRAKYEIKHF